MDPGPGLPVSCEHLHESVSLSQGQRRVRTAAMGSVEAMVPARSSEVGRNGAMLDILDISVESLLFDGGTYGITVFPG